MAEIELTRGCVAIVDDADFEWLSQWRWCVVAKGGSPLLYARRTRPHSRVYMHSLILPRAAGMLPDHRNGNGLDNRRDNLRPATWSQNAMNKRIAPGVSGYRGVTLKHGRWMAKIRVEGRHIYIGMYGEPRDAAIAYDRVARDLHGEFAVLNFPDQRAAA